LHPLGYRETIANMLSTSVTLLERVRQRDDQAAWERFVALYTPLLYRWAQRAGLGDEDAADLVQDVLVVLMNELPSFEYDTARRNFRGWLKTVTINKCRERQRRRILAMGAPGDCDILQALPSNDDLDQFWDAEYRQHLVRKALEIMRREFESTTWKACWEHAVNDKTAAQVGQELGLSEAAVYVAKSRVLRRLRHELAGLLD
jgi:RNA polymerase sigma-70 factor, ECF subfamily